MSAYSLRATEIITLVAKLVFFLPLVSDSAVAVVVVPDASMISAASSAVTALPSTSVKSEIEPWK